MLIADNTNGARLETYVMVGERGSGIIRMNGASAHLVKVGDELIIMGYELTDVPIEAKKILVDKQNRFVQYLSAKLFRTGSPGFALDLGSILRVFITKTTPAFEGLAA